MAQHFQVRYTDDIDGSDLGETANTLSFAFEGKEYSIDLSDDNAEAFRQTIAPPALRPKLRARPRERPRLQTPRRFANGLARMATTSPTADASPPT